MIAGTMTPRDGVELQFTVQEVSDGDVRVILYVGGRRAAKLNEDEQEEFLRHFLAARQAVLKVKRDLRTGRTPRRPLMTRGCDERDRECFGR